MNVEGTSECLYYIALCSIRRTNGPEMEDKVHLAGEMKEVFLEGEAEGMVCKKVFGITADRFNQS